MLATTRESQKKENETMAKTALNEKRRDMFLVLPEKLTLVSDEDHPLY